MHWFYWKERRLITQSKQSSCSPEHFCVEVEACQRSACHPYAQMSRDQIRIDGRSRTLPVPRAGRRGTRSMEIPGPATTLLWRHSLEHQEGSWLSLFTKSWNVTLLIYLLLYVLNVNRISRTLILPGSGFEQSSLSHGCIIGRALIQQKTDEFNMKLLWLIRKQTNIANYIIYFSPMLFGYAFSNH